MEKDFILNLGSKFNDPNCHLYFSKDMGETERVSIGRFTWDREKSNLNISKYGFSFYLAVHIFDGFFYHCTYPYDMVFSGYLFEQKEAGMIQIEGLAKEINGETFWELSRAFPYFNCRADNRISMLWDTWGLRTDPNYKDVLSKFKEGVSFYE